MEDSKVLLEELHMEVPSGVPSTTALSSGEICGDLHRGAGVGQAGHGQAHKPSQRHNAGRDELSLVSSRTLLMALCHGARQVCRGGTGMPPCKKEAAVSGYVCYSPSFSGRIWWEDCSARRQATLPGEAAWALLWVLEHSRPSGSAAKLSPQNRLSASSPNSCVRV